ncbi:serine hydrolase [Algoriphagus sp.]|uniref:serine hydrolase domain-containing protein n=1 Tax=Algoriphagus sp. TaxID=1872435 RepID=UPI0025DAF10B|nr:serine hydrolase [Algoriphagus sp.]
MKKLIIFLVVLFYSCNSVERGIEKPEQLNDGVETGTPQEVGIDKELIMRMTDSINLGVYPNIHSVLIFRNNKLVYEHYWSGYDENRETNFIGFTNHHRDSLHDIRSITKSIISSAVMIALSQGKIKSLDQEIFDFFPEFSGYANDIKQKITIRHLLTMSAGLDWNDSYNDSMKMESVSDTYKLILRKPMVDSPGETFEYRSSYTQLLSRIVEKATEMDIEVFTKINLFEPLGITNYVWTKEKNGLVSAWAGLRMRSRDLLKFGLLYLNDGKWKGKQLIPEYLIRESIKTQIVTEPNYGYGFQFWTLTETSKNQTISTIEASGNGGQKIEINKSKNLIVIITAGNYDKENLNKYSYDLYLDFIIPSMMKP